MNKIARGVIQVLCVSCICFGNEKGLLSRIEENRAAFMELTEPIEREVSARKKTKILDVTPAKVRVLRSFSKTNLNYGTLK